MKSLQVGIAVILLASSLGLAQDAHLTPAFRKDAMRAKDAIREIDTTYNSEEPLDVMDPYFKAQHEEKNKRIQDVLIPEARKAVNEASYDARSTAENHVVAILIQYLKNVTLQGYQKLQDDKFKLYFDMKLECEAEFAYAINGDKGLSKEGVKLAKQSRCTSQP